MAGISDLPDELLQQISDLLDRPSQKQLSHANQRIWDIATNSLWRDIRLIDTRSNHWVPEELREQWRPDTFPGRDEHDDTPIIRKLLVLAQNRRIAGKVRVLTHRCHLPLPAIFHELPRICFENATLSCDWRTIQLCLMAVRNMENVRVLRILNGHYNLTSALLNGFYGRERKHVPPHLWIESCTLRGFPLRFKSSPSAENGLQSLRLRRLRMANFFDVRTLPFRYARAAPIANLHNGIGSTYETTTDSEGLGRWEMMVSPKTFDTVPAPVKWLNERVYEQIPEATAFLRRSWRATMPYPINGRNPALRQQGTLHDDTIGVIMHFNSGTLRSINLDWILTQDGDLKWVQYQHFERLSKVHFPNLRALQLRNAVTENTRLADGIYLLHPTWRNACPEVGVGGSGINTLYHLDMLTFMENHPNLECLAWPMDRFYLSSKPADVHQSTRDRAITVVANLGRTLMDLRIDSFYTSRGEPQTDEGGDLDAKEAHICRRLFISEFAAHMTKLKVLKIEGGIPRDEKRELMRATHACPLEKVVMIGVSCPIGNTWGINGDDLSAIDEGNLQFHGLLESEHEDALAESTKLDILPSNTTDCPFRAEYGWPPGPPLIHSIALHHASTITELKFCGYNGSPILHRPTAITSSLLHHLRHFHRLRKLIMSFWLLTFFEFDWREPEIIDYWVDAREPGSTALIPVPQPALAPTPPPPTPPENATLVPEAAALADDTDDEIQEPVDVNSQDPGTATAAMDWTNTLSALTALSGNAAEDDAINTDIMMAAALGAGFMALQDQDENTVIPLTSDNNTLLDIPAAEVAATHLPPPAPAPAPTLVALETNPWEIALEKYFSPPALSKGVYDIIGPHLSPSARIGGVQVRASFCLGVESGDIFDLDFAVDREGVVGGSWVGPREESERGRWWGKLEGRGWFG